MKSLLVTFRTALAMLFSDGLPSVNLRKTMFILPILMFLVGSIPAQSTIEIDPNNFVTTSGQMQGGEIWQAGLPIVTYEGLVIMRGQISIEVHDTLSIAWISSFKTLKIKWLYTGIRDVYKVQFEGHTQRPLVAGDTAWVGFVLDEGQNMDERHAMLDGIVTADIIEFGRNVQVGTDGKLPSGGLYPVPAADHITLRHPAGEVFSEVMIIGANGLVVRKIMPNEFETTINLRGLPDGMYYIRCRTIDERLLVGSFLKKE